MHFLNIKHNGLLWEWNENPTSFKKENEKSWKYCRLKVIQRPTKLQFLSLTILLSFSISNENTAIPNYDLIKYLALSLSYISLVIMFCCLDFDVWLLLLFINNTFWKAFPFSKVNHKKPQNVTRNSKYDYWKSCRDWEMLPS